MSKHYSQKDNLITIMTEIAKKTPKGIMNGDTTVGHITWQMYLMRDYLKLDGTPLANASTGYAQLLEFAQTNNLITADTTDNSLFKYNSNTDVLTLPNYIDLCLQGGNSVEEKEAGLPNITGYFWGDLATYGTKTNLVNAGGTVDESTKTASLWNGACHVHTSNYEANWNKAISSVSATGSVSLWTSFDASHANAIYGNSQTVQPPAITLIPQIKYRKATTMYEQIDAVVNYSTTEKVVGTWIDGKPLYQKTYNSPVNQIDLTLLNIDNMVDMRGLGNDGTNILNVPYADEAGGNRYYATIYYTVETKTLNWAVKVFGNFSMIYITIQYTKTTD